MTVASDGRLRELTEDLLVRDARVHAERTDWTVTREALHSEMGATLDRVPGRHGLWLAFRTHYDETAVLRP